MALTEKFKSRDISILRAASQGDFFLDVKNPNLYKKVCRYYESGGIVFSGEEPLGDYDTLMDCIYQYLETVKAL